MPLHIALLELKLYVLDRGELALSIALPIALFALMYGAFGGESSFSATADIVDLDGGAHARALIQRLDSLDEITVRERAPQDANAALERSAITMAVVIPDGFSQSLDSGAPQPLLFRQRGSGGDTGQIVAGIVRAVAQRMSGEAQLRGTVLDATAGSNVERADVERAIAETLERAGQNPPIRVVERAVHDERPSALDRLVPGLLVMFLMFSITLGAQTLVEERRIGTLERLMTTRLTVTKLFIGKFLSGALRAVFQAVILLTLAFAALRIGGLVDYAELLALSVCVAAAVSAIGLVIGALARTRDQAVWAAVVFTMFMTVFGGTFFDVGADGPLATLARLTITRYAIESMSAVLSAGESLAQQGVGILALGGVAAVALTIARALFRVTETGR